MAICVLCEEKELSPNTKLSTCPNCRQNMSGWARRPAVEVLAYRRKLHIRDVRMENVILNPKPEDVRRAMPVVRAFETAREVRTRMREEREHQQKTQRKNGR